MKYLVTAAMALALTGAAASALADTPPNDHQHAGGHPPAGHGAPPKNGGARPHSAQTINRQHVQIHNEQVAVNRSADRGHPGFGYQRHGLRPSDSGRVAYSVNVYPQVFVAPQRFHIGFYANPAGWYAHPWGYGEYLPVGWFAPQFYLNFGLYALTPPPIGCEWVREGPDAVLIDIWTGQVLSVAHGVFY